MFFSLDHKLSFHSLGERFEFSVKYMESLLNNNSRQKLLLNLPFTTYYFNQIFRFSLSIKCSKGILVESITGLLMI